MYSGPVIDCDIHHTWPSYRELEPYLSQEWRDYLLGPGRSGPVPIFIESGFVIRTVSTAGTPTHPMAAALALLWGWCASTCSTATLSCAGS